MRLSEISYTGQPPVDGYGPGFFRVGGEVHQGSLIVSQAGVAAWEGDFSVLGTLTFDVILIGMGADIAALSQEAKSELKGQGIAYEIMATPAAARTYNVLLSEGRSVAVILTAV